MTNENQQAKCVHDWRSLPRGPHQWTPPEAEPGRVIDVEWSWAEDARHVYGPSEEVPCSPAPIRLRPRATLILRGIGLKHPHRGRWRRATLSHGLSRLRVRSHQRDGPLRVAPRDAPIRPPPGG